MFGDIINFKTEKSWMGRHYIVVFCLVHECLWVNSRHVSILY